MKEKISLILEKYIPLKEKEIINILEVPKDSNLGDYALPCFFLAGKLRKNPSEIAKELASKISKNNKFEKIEASGPYLNFFINRVFLAEEILNKIKKEKDNYGSNSSGKGKTIVIDLSSPNIAKPFGIGHLRSTIIGNSIANLAKIQGYKTIKINYLGDWGTQFGKLIAGYKKFGNAKKLKLNPINHLLEIYIKVNKKEDFEDEARECFRKLESGDKESISLWKKFKKLSLKEFNKIYKELGISFEVVSGESEYNDKLQNVIDLLKNKNLLKESEGALVVDLEKYSLGVCLIQKNDGTTLYATRDLAAALDRQEKYKFDSLLYEVGSEQKLHFQQVFKIIELLGYKWAKNYIHVDHGLYLDKDGKKFATREGKTIFMEDILKETKDLARNALLSRGKLSSKELEKRASAIALASIFYGDLKNYRSQNILFDIQRFVSFEGDTGPYLLYSYARAKSIIAKTKSNNNKNPQKINNLEKHLLSLLSSFPDIVSESFRSYAPNVIANYAFQLAHSFNEFYHQNQVIGSENEAFRLSLVSSFAQVLKNALSILGIKVIEKM